MFGLFKKQATPGEIGEAIAHLANDFLAADASRSLGMRFENWDASEGWGKFLLRQGIPMETVRLNFILFAHCAVQAACTDLDESKRRAITQGAVKGALQISPDGYDFGKTYSALEAIYRGQHKFDRQLEPLSNSDFQYPYLPNPNVGVLNAKYLIECFVIPNMKNSKAFIDEFHSYSGTVCQGIDMARKAMVQISKSVKI